MHIPIEFWRESKNKFSLFKMLFINFFLIILLKEISCFTSTILSQICFSFVSPIFSLFYYLIVRYYINKELFASNSLYIVCRSLFKIFLNIPLISLEIIALIALGLFYNTISFKVSIISYRTYFNSIGSISYEFE